MSTAAVAVILIGSWAAAPGAPETTARATTRAPAQRSGRRPRKRRWAVMAPEGRQRAEVPQAEVPEEGLRGPVQNRTARPRAAAHLPDQPPLQELPQVVGGLNPPERVDLRPRDRLAVGDDRQHLQGRPAQGLELAQPQEPLDVVPVLRPGREDVAPRHLLDLEAPADVLHLQGREGGPDFVLVHVEGLAELHAGGGLAGGRAVPVPAGGRHRHLPSGTGTGVVGGLWDLAHGSSTSATAISLKGFGCRARMRRWRTSSRSARNVTMISRRLAPLRKSAPNTARPPARRSAWTRASIFSRTVNCSPGISWGASRARRSTSAKAAKRSWSVTPSRRTSSAGSTASGEERTKIRLWISSSARRAEAASRNWRYSAIWAERRSRSPDGGSSWGGGSAGGGLGTRDRALRSRRAARWTRTSVASSRSSDEAALLR